MPGARLYVPALALAAAYSVRWLRELAPLVVAPDGYSPVYDYFRSATRVPAAK
jgi:hypothetical protein